MGNLKNLMRSILFTLILSFGLFLTACGKTSSNRDQRKIDDGNAKIAQMDEIREELARSGVLLPDQSKKTNDQIVDEMKSALDECETSKLRALQRLANEYVALGEAVLKLIHDQDVTYAGSLEDLNRRVHAAKLLSAEITEELKGRSDFVTDFDACAGCWR